MRRLGYLLIGLICSFYLFSERVVRPSVLIGKVFYVDWQGHFWTNLGQNKIAELSADGRLIKTIGGEGEGPGDIKRLGWFCLDELNDRVYVTEMVGGNKWISVFNKSSGRLEETIKLSFYNQESCGLSFVQVVGGKKLIFQKKKDFFSRRYREVKIFGIEDELINYDLHQKSWKVIYRTRNEFGADSNGKGNLTIPFGNYLYWEVMREKIVVNEISAGEVKIISLQGAGEGEIRLPFKRKRVSEEDIDRWLNSLKEWRFDLDLAFWRKNMPIPEYKPLSGGVIISDRVNTVLIAEYWESADEERNYAIVRFSKSIIQKKFAERIIYLSEKEVYFLSDAGDDHPLIKIVNRQEAGL